MKKLLPVVVFIILLLSLFSFSNAEETNKYAGTWVNESIVGTTKTIITYHVEEQKVYYSRQEYLSDGSVGNSDACVYSYEYNDDSIIFKNGDTVTKELFYVSDYCLASGKNKSWGFYYKVINISDDYAAAAAASRMEEANTNPTGKWSYYRGTEDLSTVIVTNDTGVLSFDLYFFKDGSVYLSEGYMKKNANGLFFDFLSGIWIGDAEDMTFRIENVTYKANISTDGLMHVRFPSGNTYSFVRIGKCEVE